jgi:hypothetical protein
MSFAPLCLCSLKEALYALALHLGDHRAHLGIAGEWVAHFNRAHAFYHCFEGMVVLASMHIEARARRAILPAVEGGSKRCASCHRFQVGIIKHQERCFTAQFKMNALEGFCRCFHDALTCSGRAS